MLAAMVIRMDTLEERLRYYGITAPGANPARENMIAYQKSKIKAAAEIIETLTRARHNIDEGDTQWQT